MQNQMGAMFEGKIYIWLNTVSRLQADEYYARKDQSVVTVTDLKLDRERKKRVLDNVPKI
jgi:hypothetical protein